MVSDSYVEVNNVGIARSVVTHPLPRYLIRRILTSFVAIFVLLVVTFAIVHLIPGDPAARLVPLDAQPSEIVTLRRSLGLDQSLIQQFFVFLRHAATLDFGSSFETREPVSQILANRTPRTLELVSAAAVVIAVSSVLCGLSAAGLTSGGRRRTFAAGFSGITSLMGAIPEYVSGAVLVLIFAVTLKLLPIAGVAGLQALILPTVAVSLRPTAVLSRVIRAETECVLDEEYIRTARSKRLSSMRIYVHHVLPNALTAALAVGGIVLVNILGGTIIVETLFSWPGIGSRLIQAVISRDYPVIQGTIFVLAVLVVVLTTAIDLLLAAVDPRKLARQ